MIYLFLILPSTFIRASKKKKEIERKISENIEMGFK